MRAKGREGDICTEDRDKNRDINAAYSLKSNKCQLNLLPTVSMEPLKLRVEHRHFLDCNSQAVYLIMMKHETFWANTIIILIAFRIQQNRYSKIKS